MIERTQILLLSDVIVAVASLYLEVPILFDSGVPVVLWHLLGMVSWLSIRKSSVAFCVLRPLVFIGVVKLLFVLGCWPPASLFGPSILSHSAPSVSWGAPGPLSVCSISLQ